MMTQVNDSRYIAHDINSGYSVDGRVDMTQLARGLFPLEFADTRCPFLWRKRRLRSSVTTSGYPFVLAKVCMHA